MAPREMKSSASIRLLTQREEPPTEDECIPIRDQLVRDHVECLGTIDLFNDFLRHHNLTALAEEPAFVEAVQASRKNVQKQEVLRAAIAVVWGQEEADHIIKRQQRRGSRKKASTTTLQKLKTIASRMSLAKFKQLVNALLLVRHRDAVTKFHDQRGMSIAARPRITDQELILIRDHAGPAMSYCGVEITDAIHEQVEAWVQDSDGSALVDDKPLKIWMTDATQRNFHMLEFDAYGLLVQRDLTSETSSPLFATPPASIGHSSARAGPEGPQRVPTSRSLSDVTEHRSVVQAFQTSPSECLHVDEGRAAEQDLSNRPVRPLSMTMSQGGDVSMSPPPPEPSPSPEPTNDVVPSDFEAESETPTGAEREGSLSGAQSACTSPATEWPSNSPTVVGSASPDLLKIAELHVESRTHESELDTASIRLSDNASTMADLEAEAEFGGGTPSEDETPLTPREGLTVGRIDDVPATTIIDKSLTRSSTLPPDTLPGADWIHDVRLAFDDQANRRYEDVRSLALSAAFDPPDWAATALAIGRWRSEVWQGTTTWMRQVRGWWFSPGSTTNIDRLTAVRAAEEAHGNAAGRVRLTAEDLSHFLHSEKSLTWIAFIASERRDDAEDCRMGFERLVNQMKELDATFLRVLYATDSIPGRASVSDVVRYLSGDEPLLATHVESGLGKTKLPDFHGRFRSLESLLRRTCNRRDCDYLQQSIYARDVLTTGHIANPGACSGARVDVLAGTWISVSFGVVIIATVVERHNPDQLRELSEGGRMWDPRFPQQAVILHHGDVVYVPAGVIYSVAAVDRCQISYRAVWDDQDIVKSLAALSKLGLTEIVRLIDMGICTDLPIAELLRELEINPGRYGVGNTGIDLATMAAAQDVLRMLNSVSDDGDASRAAKRRRIDL